MRAFLDGFVNRHWRVIAAYTVLLALAWVAHHSANYAGPVIWSGRYPFTADDQAELDAIESRHWSNVARAASRHRDAKATLELTSELRVVP